MSWLPVEDRPTDQRVEVKVTNACDKHGAVFATWGRHGIKIGDTFYPGASYWLTDEGEDLGLYDVEGWRPV